MCVHGYIRCICTICTVQEGTIKHFKLEISGWYKGCVCLCVQNEILKFYGLKRKPQNENIEDK